MNRLLMASILIVAAMPFAQANQQLAASKGCLGCHAPDKELIGPAYKDVAAKYAGKGDAVATLAKHIKNGVKGNWPNIKYKGGMPPNPVSEAEAQELAKWVLSLK